MSKYLFGYTEKTTEPLDSELMVGGTGAAPDYTFRWGNMVSWIKNKLVGAATIWTSDNDGVGSGLDADTLQNETPATLRDRALHTGNAPGVNVSIDTNPLTDKTITNVQLLAQKVDANPADYIPQGEIDVAADFPTLGTVQPGWLYVITSNVTDNDVTKTNTGQSFLEGVSIVWAADGSWLDLGSNYVTQAQKDKIDLGANFVKHINLSDAAITPFEGATVTPDEDGVYPNYGGLKKLSEACDFVYLGVSWFKKTIHLIKDETIFQENATISGVREDILFMSNYPLKDIVINGSFNNDEYVYMWGGTFRDDQISIFLGKNTDPDAQGATDKIICQGTVLFTPGKTGVEWLELDARDDSLITARVLIDFDIYTVDSDFGLTGTYNTAGIKRELVGEALNDNNLSKTDLPNVAGVLDDVLYIAAKYNASDDIIFKFETFGANDLTSFTTATIASNTENYPSLDISRAGHTTIMNIQNSDNIGPIIFDGEWTGGAHEYLGNPTALEISHLYLADGVELVKGDLVRCSVVNVHTSNNLFRPLDLPTQNLAIKEKVSYSISKASIQVSVNHEDVLSGTLGTYYGMQLVFNILQDNMYYSRSQHAGLIPALAIPSDSGDDTTYPDSGKVILCSSDEVYCISMYMDKTVGLGKDTDINITAPLIFNNNFGKTYFRLLENKPVVTGDVWEWRGVYTFYDQTEIAKGGAVLSHNFILSKDEIATADFENAGVSNMVIEDKEGDISEVVNKDASITVLNEIHSKAGVKVSASTKGTIYLR